MIYAAPMLASRQAVAWSWPATRVRGGGCTASKSSKPAGGGDAVLSSEIHLAEQAVGNLARYTKPSSIWEALATGHVRLLRMSWLIAHSKAGRVLARRQALPEEAFISVDELKRIFGEGNRDGVLPIVVISFCWLTPADPDPEGKQLATIAAALERERAHYTTANGSFKGFDDMGVFWDWASLYQKDPALWAPCCGGPTFVAPEARTAEQAAAAAAYESSRTASEKEGFDFALDKTMDLWYAHQGTTVYMLTKLPEGSTREVGYSASGWTTYERCSAEQSTPPPLACFFPYSQPH